MAISIASKKNMITTFLILILVMFSSADVLLARSDGSGFAKNGIDSWRMLREMELEYSKIINKKNSMGRRVLGGKINREAPEGPDPQHH
ncbi:hypothetical protein ABFX02_08G136200 [Erythranthe guttata]